MAIKILETCPIDISGTLYLRLPRAWLEDNKVNTEVTLETYRNNKEYLIIKIKGRKE